MPTVHVEMVMKVVTGFRTYSATQGFVLDQARQENQLVFTGNADNYRDALRQLPTPEECIRRVAQHADEWAVAEPVWQQAARNLHPAIAGRVFYNLAVASEVRGDLPGVIDWAKKSAFTCNNGQAKSYLRILNDRLRVQEVVREQLKSVLVMN